MKLMKRYLPAIASVLLMYIVLCIIYPHYQYYIDPDGTAYLTISHRYAVGDYITAINGYWSPWSCWLTALVIKAGFADIPASVIVNALGASGFLLVSQSFFLKFNIISKLQWTLCVTLSLFLCYAVFWQSFDDLWECFFLLFILRIMVQDGFKNKPALWISCGVLGALAYFAKAYSFPFFILNTICCTWFISKDNKKQWLKICAVAISVMLLCSLPWICLLHNKYGIWTTSTAGRLNMSWYLVGHPHWKPGIDALIPPAYKDSPYYWEDPYIANGITPHFWDSWHLLGLQVLKAGYNVVKFLLGIVQLSVLFPVIGGIAVLSLMDKFGLFGGKAKLLIISCLLFPLVYVLINFESRYLWYLQPVGMVLGALLIQSSAEGSWKKFIVIIFPLTFLIYPAWRMRKMYDEGKQDYKIAQELKKNNIKGTFTSRMHEGVELQQMERIAYFSGNPLYIQRQPYISDKDLFTDMCRYKVNYFLICDNSSYSFELIQGNLLNKNGVVMSGIYKEIPGVSGGVKVFTVNP